MRRPRNVWLMAGVVFLAGCSLPNAPLPPVPYDPEAGTEEAFSTYDTNKDGFLDADELNACPGLKAALPNIDKDRDKKISRDELRKRIELYASSGVSAMTLPVTVQAGGKPAEGVVLTFTPERFLGPGVKPASGTTDANGTANPQVEGAEVAGLAYGIYRVSASKKDAGGQETIPARYNANTTLGYEVGPDSRGGYQLQLSGGR